MKNQKERESSREKKDWRILSFNCYIESVQRIGLYTLIDQPANLTNYPTYKDTRAQSVTSSYNTCESLDW